MERMHLDFLHPHARHVGLGVLLLLAGAMAAGALLVQHYRVARETALLEERISDAGRLARRAMPRLEPMRVGGRALTEEIRDANAVIERLNVPWDVLFRDIEAVSGDGVTLLAIQPDPASRKVRIAGEARKLSAVLAYVERLEARKGLANVYLVAHEMRDTPPRPIAFTLSAQWTGPR
ncbi:MAG: PilN domain-containing protein [Burkholderiales bacterium]